MKGIQHILLWPFSLLYGGVMALRNWCFDQGLFHATTFDIPVLSLGNITVGGTGKTPHTEYLVRLLGQDYSVAILSRGYGRKTKGFRVVEVDSLPHSCGDEPCQIKQKFPHITVVVCEDRREGIKRLTAMGHYDVVLLDDAFQHRWVKPDWSAVLVDYSRPIFRDAVMPAGRLREFPQGLRRADCVVVTKCPLTISKLEKEEFGSRLGMKGQTLFFSNFRYGNLCPVFAASTGIPSGIDQVLLVTGIAQPQPLADHLMQKGYDVRLCQFPDHHMFVARDIEKITKQFEALTSSSRCIITTEKDAVRLRQLDGLSQAIKENLYYLPIEVNLLGGEEELIKIILSYVRKNK